MTPEDRGMLLDKLLLNVVHKRLWSDVAKDMLAMSMINTARIIKESERQMMLGHVL